MCGSREVGKAVEDVCVKLTMKWVEVRKGEQETEEAAREWFEKQRNERFATDVFD